MDKHRPIKLVLQNIVHSTILVFKIVDQYKSNEEVTKMKNEYKKFIYSLLLDDNIKDSLIYDLEINWICDKWHQSFINERQEPHMYDLPRIKPMTNNSTERMNKTIEL
ncbi:8157_t:CDS:2 [Cetraspora pellucida]|uniref:8157_t:CDS:1 n=1 Tax=Cetraspora pellucida TaxID=1433469 RepID=A0A9N9GMH1_9GLOM|nr:8157_t:CDS:2 [Cetraspora pellucida]